MISKSKSWQSELIKMPSYYQCPSKIEAREENISVYRRLTGHKMIPDNRAYWTLCNQQPIESGSEIVQAVDLGLLKKEQFHGVDRDGDIIRQNKVWHPKAKWYCGEWVDIIRDVDFNPDFIYLDSTSFASFKSASDLVSSTMYLCSLGCVICANLMLSDPRSSKTFCEKSFIHNLEKNVGSRELRKWKSEVSCYVYNATGKTLMITYILFKESV